MHEYIKSIMDSLRGKTGNNFQKSIGDVLSVYYDYKELTYEMPSPYGGDDKNDGWVKEEKLFYQIYAPVIEKSSDTLEKLINKKFEVDLNGLLNIVVNKNKWGGEINEFVFIVQTHDNNLPKDSSEFYKNKVAELSVKYNVSFKYRLTNLDYISDLLSEVEDEKVFKKIILRINVNKANVYDVTQAAIINLINKINTNIVENTLVSRVRSSDYSKVKISNKIDINHLGDRSERILDIHKNLFLVEDAIAIMQNDIMQQHNFIRSKEWIIGLYDERKNSNEELQVYNDILEEIISNTDKDNISILISEYILVYIFNQCDIFKKVEE